MASDRIQRRVERVLSRREILKTYLALDYLYHLPSSGESLVTEASENLVRRMYEEAWNEGKLEVIDELCAADYIGVGPYGEEHGPDSVKRGVANRRSAFPDIHVTIEDIISVEDKVVARLTFRGTHKGEFQGIQPTNKEVKWTGIWIYRVANGKLIERWHNYDLLGLMQQLGAIPV